MKKSIWLVMAGLMLMSLSVDAQSRRKKSSDKEKFTEKLWYGGGFGLGIGGSTFNLDLSPMVGYKITDKFSAGIRIPFDYSFAKLSASDGRVITYNNLDFGIGGFTRHKIAFGLFAHAEVNKLWLEQPVTQGNSFLIDPDNPNRLLLEDVQREEFNIGLGYSSGNRIGYEVSLLYNVLEDSNSLNNPWSIRVGFNYKF